MTDLLAIVLMFVGLFFLLTASLGVWKFPDIYTRLHAIGKASSFGFGFLIIGTAVYMGDAADLMKAILAVLFLFLTTPVSCHMIARVALRHGYRPVINPQGDLAQPLPMDDLGEDKKEGDPG